MATETRDTIYTILQNQVGSLWVQGGAVNSPHNIAFSDEEYFMPSNTEVRKFLQHTKISLGGSGRKADCDKYAKLMVAKAIQWVDNDPSVNRFWCFGMAWGSFQWMPDEYHACNFFVNPDYALYWVEPQSNTIYDLAECTGNLSFMLL